MLTLIGLIFFRKISLMNPIFWFIIFNWVMGVGVLFLLNFENDIDIVHANLTLMTLLFFCIGAFFSIKFFNIDGLYIKFWNRDKIITKFDIKIASIFFFISVIASLIYYKLVGYNLFFSALLGGGVDDFTSMRLEAYAGESYFAPGYFNQFKNTLLPITFIYLIFALKSGFKKNIFIILGAAIVLYSLLGTGQRTFLVMAFILYFFILFGVNRSKINYTYLTLMFSVVLVFFGFGSVLLGRTEDLSFVDTVSQFFYRVFASNQYTSVVGFQYIYDKDIIIGSDWLKSLTGVLPGMKGSTISSEIFAVIFGSTRGTAPLSTWGSFYYNFGFFGTCLGAFILAWFYSYFYYIFISGNSNLLRVVLYGGLFLYLSIWLAGSPMQIINNGALAVLILLLIRRLRFEKTGNY